MDANQPLTQSKLKDDNQFQYSLINNERNPDKSVYNFRLLSAIIIRWYLKYLLVETEAECKRQE